MGKTKVLRIFILLVGLTPASKTKNSLLRRSGFHIPKDCSFGISLIWSTSMIRLESGCRIRNFNVFRGLAEVSLKASAVIGSWNWFSASSEFPPRDFRSRLIIGRGSAITSRHYIDCSGGVVIGELSTIGGQRSTFLSHGIDFDRNRQTAEAIHIGDTCFISTGCTLLKGTILPSRSVLAAGAVLTSQDEMARPGLWAGVPAIWKKELTGEYFERKLGRVSVDPFD